MIPGLPPGAGERPGLAMSRHPIGHRSAEFQSIVRAPPPQLSGCIRPKRCAGAHRSGTAARKPNSFQPCSARDKVLCGDNGKFGERLGEGGQGLRLEVEVIEAEWGQPLDS